MNIATKMCRSSVQHIQRSVHHARMSHHPALIVPDTIGAYRQCGRRQSRNIFLIKPQRLRRTNYLRNQSGFPQKPLTCPPDTRRAPSTAPALQPPDAALPCDRSPPHADEPPTPTVSVCCLKPHDPMHEDEPQVTVPDQPRGPRVATGQLYA